MSDLEQVLNGEVTTEEPAEQPIEQPNEVEDVQANADDSEQVIEPTGEEETTTPVVENDPVEGFKATALAEREKRQAAEQRAQQLEAYVRQQQSKQEKPDFWENPEGVLGNFGQQMQAQMRQMQTNMSVEMMRTSHDDYDTMETQFVELAQQNPALIAEMNASANPAKFAYDYAKTQNEIKQMQDPGYRDKLKAELRAEIEAETKAKIESDIKKKADLPGSLSNERAAGGNSAAPYAAPSLETLIGN